MAYSFSRPSAQRAARVLALRRDSADGPPSTDAGPLSGELHDPVTGLTVPAGTLTAVVCGDPDTAGRLAERLGGHPTGGDSPLSVLLGGVPLDGVPLEEARTAVLVQDKDPVLLSGTLRELLDVPRSGRVTPEQALAAAQCDDVLDALLRAGPDGDPAEAPVTERGRSLSGGQRQRLALARSLVADPEVLVLDDPTSAVDSHTEARIAQALRQVRGGRTTVVLSSSPLLLARAEHVAFLQGGKVTDSGTHHQLLRTDGEYRAVVTRETEPGPDLDAAAEGAERA